MWTTPPVAAMARSSSLVRLRVTSTRDRIPECEAMTGAWLSCTAWKTPAGVSWETSTMSPSRFSSGTAFFPSAEEYSRLFGLDGERMRRLPDHAIIMHPGPMNRGLEISAEAADAARSVIVEQVANGVAVRMAALYLLLAGEESLA